jgi:signal transduction histidine kinase
MILDDRSADVPLRTHIWQLAALSCGALAILGLLAVWTLAQDRDGYEAVARHNSTILALVVVTGCGVAALLILAAARRIVRRIEHRGRELIADKELGNAALAQSDRYLEAETEMHSVTQASLLRSLAELKRSNDELDSFAYAVSHDFKAPLRGIRNLTDWIVDDIQGGKVGNETTKNLALLRNRVDRLHRLLDSLLEYSRVGRIDRAIEEVDSASLIDDIAEYIAPPDGFTINKPGEMPIIQTEKLPLERVLLNLIGNALKHHDRTVGTVTVTARDIGDVIEFCVEDDGPGIEPGFHARIFQMFQTLKPRDELEGNGMGLAIVKKSVEGHGGTIRVISAPPVRGSTFVFTWAKVRDRQDDKNSLSS